MFERGKLAVSKTSVVVKTETLIEFNNVPNGCREGRIVLVGQGFGGAVVQWPTVCNHKGQPIDKEQIHADI